MTESRVPSPKPPAPPAAKPTPARAKAKAPARAKAIAAVPKAVGDQIFSHPNLGLAPADMTASHPAAAAKIRGEAVSISAGALEAAVKTDPTLRTRYDDIGLRLLLRDGELLVERLAMCLAGGRDRWLTDYAEWIGPIQRRRGVPLGDLAKLCAGIREQVEPQLNADELAAATRSLDAAAAVFNRNGRVAGDRHKRNALLKWMYRGV